MSVGGDSSARTDRGTDLCRRPRVLRGRLPPGRRLSAEVWAALCRPQLARDARGGMRPGTWSGGLGAGGPAGLEGASWPLPSGHLGAHSLFTPRPFLASNAPVRAPPAPEVVAGAGSAWPLCTHRVGHGPLSVALVG